jgi:hypothetical protein
LCRTLAMLRSTSRVRASFPRPKPE